MANNDKRKSKVITDPKDIEYISSITESDITTTFIMEMFGEFETGRRLLNDPPKMVHRSTVLGFR